MLLTATTYGTLATIRKRLPQACAEQGFGFLGEVDLGGKMQEQGGTWDRPCIVFDVYDAAQADRLLATRIDACAVLPCRIAVYPHDDGKTRIVTVRPTRLAGLFGDAEVDEMARDAEARLEAVLTGVAQ
jgi:uncharacterized protein (DUF302 family)